MSRVIAGCVIVATFAYLLFLAATWNQYQQDRANRDDKINQLLDRMPPPQKTPTVIVEAS